ncbi:DNA cytosine methyltransferase [Paenilisteria rocourtiae]|uniref:Cytosine-specific methyltransferase n=1 Tax=Listeria rocourtiae TaxID=647910 RepID=A0A4V3DQ78_9LIST|nr:DNA (cytosine-5-)-methyltransferase [Listeria rocourtiae]EUJ44440.1 modification methylase ScrFIB [Listeria rocourtiae FSL F6-920]TDR55076.1 DNA (cytosine-5)-methyltransferase 1 [Listeria rocourtiae]
MIKTLELFGGIGAPRKALVNLGIEHKSIDYVEIDEKAVRAYNALYDKTIQPQSVIGYNLRPDVLVHGSPCQDFSRAGYRWGGGSEDKTRSSLLFETLKIIRNMGAWKPRVVLWENVKGVLDRDMVHAFKDYLAQMDEMGYTSSYEVLNAMDFGIPQKRERIYTISVLNGERFNFSLLEKKPTRPIGEFLESDTDDIYTIKIPSMLSKIEALNMQQKNAKYNRYLDVIDTHCWTISTRQDRCPNAGIVKLNSHKYRYLTELECARLMGFSDEDHAKLLTEYPTKKGKKNATLYKLYGNSIVVDVLETIYKGLFEMGVLKLEEASN